MGITWPDTVLRAFDQPAHDQGGLGRCVGELWTPSPRRSQQDFPGSTAGIAGMSQETPNEGSLSSLLVVLLLLWNPHDPCSLGPSQRWPQNQGPWLFGRVGWAGNMGDLWTCTQKIQAAAPSPTVRPQASNSPCWATILSMGIFPCFKSLLWGLNASENMSDTFQINDHLIRLYEHEKSHIVIYAEWFDTNSLDPTRTCCCDFWVAFLSGSCLLR